MTSTVSHASLSNVRDLTRHAPPPLHIPSPHMIAGSESSDSPLLIFSSNDLPSPTTGIMRSKELPFATTRILPSKAFDWEADYVFDIFSDPDFAFLLESEPASFQETAKVEGNSDVLTTQSASSSPESEVIQTNPEEGLKSVSSHHKRPRQSAGEDGFNWRKYGEYSSGNRRSYYKCTYPGCQVKKHVEMSSEGQVTDVVYNGSHTHSTSRSSSSSLCDDSSQGNSYDDDDLGQRCQKRLKGNGKSITISAPALGTAREASTVIRTASDIGDGYRWRKYGTKVIVGNLNPRHYYKCSTGACPAKKQVEQASHDVNILITTYEGKHNHEVPPARTYRPLNRPMPTDVTSNIA